jgi:2,5-furandicarboxylate decarboxylase 1
MTPPPVPQTIRTFLAELESTGDVLHIGERVASHHELAAYLTLLDGGPAVVFEQVDTSPFRVAANLLSSRERIALALGTTVEQIQPTLVEAVQAPIAPELVSDVPVQEIVDESVDLGRLPIPTFFARESGAYVTAGMIIAKDPVTGQGNASFARLKVLGRDRAFIGIAPNHHLAQLAQRASDLGRHLEIAVVLGAHPAIQLAACLYLRLGDDELHCAGRLLGAPVRVAPARTVDLLIPAEAEMVLEGTIDWHELVEEGPVSEFHGMYEHYGQGATVHFSTVTSRRDAIFQVVQPGWHREHIYLGAVPIAAGLTVAARRAVPTVRDVAITEAGAGRISAVVSLDRGRPGQAKRVMFACWAAVSLVKQVTVVDADIDVWDPVAVEWARLTRMRAERDIVIVEGVAADRAEPMEAGGTVTKIGFDATGTAGDRLEGWDRALPPAEVVAAVRARLHAAGHL